MLLCSHTKRQNVTSQWLGRAFGEIIAHRDSHVIFFLFLVCVLLLFNLTETSSEGQETDGEGLCVSCVSAECWTLRGFERSYSLFSVQAKGQREPLPIGSADPNRTHLSVETLLVSKWNEPIPRPTSKTCVCPWGSKVTRGVQLKANSGRDKAKCWRPLITPGKDWWGEAWSVISDSLAVPLSLHNFTRAPNNIFRTVTTWCVFKVYCTINKRSEKDFTTFVDLLCYWVLILFLFFGACVVVSLSKPHWRFGCH